MENKGKKGKQATIALLEFFHQQVLYHYMCLAKTKPMLKKKPSLKGRGGHTRSRDRLIHASTRVMYAPKHVIHMPNTLVCFLLFQSLIL